MLKIGITGNMGSGKSTVAKIFSALDIPVYDADARAKAIMVEDIGLVQQIKLLLGNRAYLPQPEAGGLNQLNRTFISRLVFNDKELLTKLNGLVHPAVFRDFDSWVGEQQAIYVLKEAALLYESNSYQTLDKMIVVSSHHDIRLQRCISRDHSNVEAVEARMKNQMPEEEKVKRADFIIYNNENDLLIPQVMHIHRQILALV